MQPIVGAARRRPSRRRRSLRACAPEAAPGEAASSQVRRAAASSRRSGVWRHRPASRCRARRGEPPWRNVVGALRRRFRSGTSARARGVRAVRGPRAPPCAGASSLPRRERLRAEARVRSRRARDRDPARGRASRPRRRDRTLHPRRGGPGPPRRVRRCPARAGSRPSLPTGRCRRARRRARRRGAARARPRRRPPRAPGEHSRRRPPRPRTGGDRRRRRARRPTYGRGGCRARRIARERTTRRRRSPSRGLALRLLLGGDLLADLLERAANQPRDVHLRDAHLLGDLRLRQPFEEAQMQDLSLALVEHTEARREHGTVLRHVVLVLLGPDRFERVELLAVLLPAARGQRERGVRTARLERLEHLFLLGAGRLCELTDRRRASELDRELLDEARQLHVQLLEPARHPHRPALVAEVPLDLADDVRRRVGRQLDAAVEVEAVDRLDQADGADLDEILELLAAVRVAPGERAHERHVLLDQLLARLEVALLVVAPQENLVGLVHPAVPFVVCTCFVSSTHSDPSRSEISTLSQTAPRMRERLSASASPCSSSERTDANGPTTVRNSPSKTRTRSVTPSSVCARSSNASSANSRSSRLSTLMFSRAASPPSTRWAT